MMRKYVGLIVIVLVAVMAVTTWADKIYVKTGGFITGTIKEETKTKIVLDIDGIMITLDRSDVVAIETGGEKRYLIDGDTEPAPTVVGGPPKAKEAKLQATPVEDLPLHEPVPVLTVPKRATPNLIKQTLVKPPTVKPRPTLPPGEQPILPVTIPRGKAYRVIRPGVNFREGPNTSYPIVEVLNLDASLVIWEERDQWLHGQTADGSEGWIFDQLADPLGDAMALVMGEKLNFRTGPGRGYPTTSRLHKGEVVKVLRTQGKWSQILTYQEQIGWVYNQFIKELDNTEAMAADLWLSETLYQGLVTAQAVRGRLDPDAPMMDKPFVIKISDDNLIKNGVLAVVALIKKGELGNIGTTNLLADRKFYFRQVYQDQEDLLELGFPQAIAADYEAAVVGRMLVERNKKVWTAGFRSFSSPAVDYFTLTQQGPDRGRIIPLGR